MYTKKHIEDFESSGLTEDTVIKAEIEAYPEAVLDDGYDTRGRVKKKYYSGGWKVPITHPLTGELYYHRLKPDEPLIENKGKKNERKIKYLTPSGAKPHLYFAKNVNWKEVFESNKEIIITEGEKKALKLIQEGYIAVAVSGVWCWQKDNIPIADLGFITQKKRKVFLSFDSDYKTNPQVKMALDTLYEYLLEKGCNPIFACSPGPEKGVDDYIVSKGIESWNSYINILRAQYAEQSNYERRVEIEALKMLKSPDYLTKILIEDVKKLGLYGEEENVRLLYCAMAAHKLENSVGILIKGDSSTGKTFLVNTVGSLMPDGVFEPVTGVSTQAISYWTDISHKIIFVSESRPISEEFFEADNVWRQLIEEHEITRKVAVRNPQTNKWECDTVTVKGPITYISTATALYLNEENENRLVVTNTNHDPGHVKEVLQLQREEEWLSPSQTMKLEEERAFIRAKHKKAIELLEPVPYNQIRIPFIKGLEFNTFTSSAMRDQKKLFKILKIVAWLNQMSHQVSPCVTDMSLFGVTVNSQEFARDKPQIDKSLQVSHVSQGREVGKNVCVSFEDYVITFNILRSIFDSEASEIPDSLQKRWECLYKEFGDMGTFKVKDFCKLLSIKRTRATVLIKQMVDLSMIKEEDVVTGKAKSYKCIYYTRSSASMTDPGTLKNFISKVSDTCDTSAKESKKVLIPSNSEELTDGDKKDVTGAKKKRFEFLEDG